MALTPWLQPKLCPKTPYSVANPRANLETGDLNRTVHMPMPVPKLVANACLWDFQFFMRLNRFRFFIAAPWRRKRQKVDGVVDVVVILIELKRCDTRDVAPHCTSWLILQKGPSDRQKDSQTIDAWPRVATFMKIERVVKHFIHLNPRKLERGLQTVLPKRKKGCHCSRQGNILFSFDYWNCRQWHFMISLEGDSQRERDRKGDTS